MTVSLQACGCQRVHHQSYGHTCIVHDENGKRWDSYSADEVATRDRLKVEVQTSDTGWTCCCGRHGPDDMMWVGTACWWSQVAIESDEYECRCLESHRDDWLLCVTTDWIAMATADGLAR